MKDQNVAVTIGTDEATAQAIDSLGGKHQNCQTDQAVIDREHKIVSTPAYMDAEAKLATVAQGIDQCIEHVLDLA